MITCMGVLIWILNWRKLNPVGLGILRCRIKQLMEWTFSVSNPILQFRVKSCACYNISGEGRTIRVVNQNSDQIDLFVDKRIHEELNYIKVYEIEKNKNNDINGFFISLLINQIQLYFPSISQSGIIFLQSLFDGIDISFVCSPINFRRIWILSFNQCQNA